MAPETRQGIAVIFFFALAAVLILSILGMAGSAGAFLATGLGTLAGQAAPLIPLILAGIGVLLLIPKPPGSRGTSIIGMLLFLVATTGGLTTLARLIPSLDTGGYLGLVVSSPLISGFGATATLVIFAAVILTALFLIFHISFVALAKHGRLLGRLLGILLLPIFAVQKLFARKPHIHGVHEMGEIAREATFVTKEIIKKEKNAAPTKTVTGDKGSGFAPNLKRRGKPFAAIPLDLLNQTSTKPTAGDIKKGMEIIEKTLANFGITVTMGDVSVGPTVTQYTFKPDEGMKLTKITALANDLALALAAHPIRMEAPIPGKSLVGLEVPNKAVATVNLREVLESGAFKERSSNLMLALGKDVSGKPWLTDLDRLPHLLVAGATGSGKTVCLNSFIVSLLYANSPDDLRFILIDPKRVELPIYNGIPHLLVPVITDVPKTVNALRWAINEMERRFTVLEKFGARDIASFNARAEEKMPAIVIVIDELADLMASSASEVEGSIIRIAQMARAVGIHLVVATQRPSVDVITGLIKANIPARIAFAVASQIDSRTILDSSGAEKLLGRGDLLFTAPEISKPRRIQGAFVGDEEIRRVVNHLKVESESPEYDSSIVEKQRSPNVVARGEDSGDNDPLIPEAKEVILQAGKASASLLQRRLKVGYARAARLLDLLEAAGFIGPGEGAKPREILADAPNEEEFPPWE